MSDEMPKFKGRIPQEHANLFRDKPELLLVLCGIDEIQQQMQWLALRSADRDARVAAIERKLSMRWAGGLLKFAGAAALSAAIVILVQRWMSPPNPGSAPVKQEDKTK